MNRFRVAAALIATALIAGCSFDIASPGPAAPTLMSASSEVRPSLSETESSGNSAAQDSVPSRLGQPFLGSGN